MKVLLVALNAKYIHSNLAVYSLRAYAEKYRDQIEIAEYTINHYLDDILGDIYKKKPDIIGFSCYIWNIRMIEEVAKELRKILPKVVIWFGGPEVSYDAEIRLCNQTYLDGIFLGEGEESFSEFLDYYLGKKGKIQEIKGIAYRESSDTAKGFTTRVNEIREPMDMSQIPFPYDNLDHFEHKVIYYESSRGCPYSCSYCLSSIDKRVRFRNTELVMKELQFFLDHNTAQVKFIDRTFNCNHNHAITIWRYIKENDNGITNFHFEISADILNEEEIALLNSMRPGLVQLEIGVQSTNPATITAIQRNMDLNKLKAAVTKIKESGNIHQHLDLIAGLPFEGYQLFQRSFQEVYALKPDQLQLGFLKVLKGSHMESVSKEHGIVYKDFSPYEVLQTKWLSYDEVLRLKQVEEMVEVYYNSGQFCFSIRYLEHKFKATFDLYEALGDFYNENSLLGLKHTRINRYQLLLEFFNQHNFGQEEYFAQLLIYDLYLREKLKSRPTFAKEYTEADKKRNWDFYNDKDKLEKYLGDYDGYNAKQISRMTHMEHFQIDIIQTVTSGNFVKREHDVLFNYENRNVLNSDAETIDLG